MKNGAGRMNMNTKERTEEDLVHTDAGQPLITEDESRFLDVICRDYTAVYCADIRN